MRRRQQKAVLQPERLAIGVLEAVAVALQAVLHLSH